MKLFLVKSFLLSSIFLISFLSRSQTTIDIMDEVIFFNRYESVVFADPAPPIGVIRHRNYLSAIMLTEDQLSLIGDELQLNVEVTTLCDDYDRLGHVNIAMVPKGSTTYDLESAERFEIARFITPLTDKNVEPSTVPFVFNIDNVSKILRDIDLNEKYDFWIEFSILGLPFSARGSIDGCADRSDVSKGRIELVTNTPAPKESKIIFKPIVLKENFNNYEIEATDEIGSTVKALKINTYNDIVNAALYLIISNHGITWGGEEFFRRTHNIYFNDQEVLSFLPGRKTCEPFRKYNNRLNYIYTDKIKSSEEWMTSNWCPGDVIDTRKIELGNLEAGDHIFKIEVPDALFRNEYGNFPFSLYLQGEKTDPLSIKNHKLEKLFSIYPNPSNGNFFIEHSSKNAELIITDIAGKVILEEQINKKTQNVSIETNGIYFVTIQTDEGRTTEKVIISN